MKIFNVLFIYLVIKLNYIMKIKIISMTRSLLIGLIFSLLLNTYLSKCLYSDNDNSQNTQNMKILDINNGVATKINFLSIDEDCLLLLASSYNQKKIKIKAEKVFIKNIKNPDFTLDFLDSKILSNIKFQDVEIKSFKIKEHLTAIFENTHLSKLECLKNGKFQLLLDNTFNVLSLSECTQIIHKNKKNIKYHNIGYDYDLSNVKFDSLLIDEIERKTINFKKGFKLPSGKVSIKGQKMLTLYNFEAVFDKDNYKESINQEIGLVSAEIIKDDKPMKELLIKNNTTKSLILNNINFDLLIFNPNIIIQSILIQEDAINSSIKIELNGNMTILKQLFIENPSIKFINTSNKLIVLPEIETLKVNSLSFYDIVNMKSLNKVTNLSIPFTVFNENKNSLVNVKNLTFTSPYELSSTIINGVNLISLEINDLLNPNSPNLRSNRFNQFNLSSNTNTNSRSKGKHSQCFYSKSIEKIKKAISEIFLNDPSLIVKLDNFTFTVDLKKNQNQFKSLKINNSNIKELFIKVSTNIYSIRLSSLQNLKKFTLDINHNMLGNSIYIYLDEEAKTLIRPTILSKNNEFCLEQESDFVMIIKREKCKQQKQKEIQSEYYASK